jgi:hypothetical protein
MLYGHQKSSLECGLRVWEDTEDEPEADGLRAMLGWAMLESFSLAGRHVACLKTGVRGL